MRLASARDDTAWCHFTDRMIAAVVPSPACLSGTGPTTRQPPVIFGGYLFDVPSDRLAVETKVGPPCPLSTCMHCGERGH